MKIKAKVREKQSSIALINAEVFNDMLCAGYTPLAQNPEVLSAIDCIAELISSMTIYLMQNTDKGDKRIKNALSRLIDIEPNNFMTRKVFMAAVVRELLLTGNAVVVPEYTDEGLIKSLTPVSTGNVSFIPQGSGYYLIVNGVRFEQSEILHFQINNKPPYSWLGHSYDRRLRAVIETLSQASETKRSFMESKWKPSLIIKADAAPDAMGNQLGRSQILNDYIKSSRAGEPWLIPADTFEVQEVKPLSLNDLAITDSVELDKKTVAAAFGVPGYALGIGDFKKDEWNNFINTKIKQIADMMQEEYTKKLIIKPEWYIKFSARSLYAYDINELSTVGINLYQRGILSGNEVRDWLDLGPHENLDELVILENYIPQGMIGDQKKLNGGENNSTANS